ncbi:MAG: RNA-binding protein [Proteobacteria bacterium]|nr:RNA-binding protein [Pseudomonadota bacterium]
MPIGPHGERRPADSIGCAVMVAKIATGEIDETPIKKSGRVRSGIAGAKARAENLTAEKRRDIAKKAAAKRWA